MSDNLSPISINNSQNSGFSKLTLVIVFIVISAAFVYLLLDNDKVPVSPEVVEAIVESTPVPEVIEESIVGSAKPDVVADIAAKVILPELDQSDVFILDKFSLISWRKELKYLILTDDLVRRIVVFTDNFSRGELAYSHLPLKPLQGKFQVDIVDGATTDNIIASTANELRYLQYIELLQSFESQTLVAEFISAKPLFEQAYAELGYGDKSFEQCLQQAINRILNIPVPNTAAQLIRPNVIYKYKQQSIEKLSPADKFLMRLGKENLLQLKAVALELDNQLKQQSIASGERD